MSSKRLKSKQKVQKSKKDNLELAKLFLSLFVELAKLVTAILGLF